MPMQFALPYVYRPHPLGRRWHSILIDEEDQIVAWRSYIPIRRRRCLDRGGCSAGDCTANVSLIMVEGVGYRAGPHEHDLRDSPGSGRIYRKGSPVGDRRWRAGDRRTRLEEVRGEVSLVGSRAPVRVAAHDHAPVRE